MIEFLKRLGGLAAGLAAIVYGLMTLAVVFATWPAIGLALVVLLAAWLAAQARDARRRRTEEIARQTLEREKLARLEWERSPEGQAFLEQQRREAAEAQQRMEVELRARRDEEDRRRREAHEKAARAEWNAFFESKTMLEVALMTGLEFEQFLARLLPRLGYSNIVLTPINDQGGDILCSSNTGEQLVVQAKRWKGSLGNAVVQEILGAMLHYGCSQGMIITNSTFTAAARVLASKDPRISLHDGAWLADQIKEHLPSEIPPFDWRRYNEEVVRSRFQSQSSGRVPAGVLDGGTLPDPNDVLARVAAGEMTVEEATKLLGKAEPAKVARTKAVHGKPGRRWRKCYRRRY